MTLNVLSEERGVVFMHGRCFLVRVTRPTVCMLYLQQERFVGGLVVCDWLVGVERWSCRGGGWR